MAVEELRRRYRGVNGNHVMTAADGDYVRQWFVRIPAGAGLTNEEVLA
jgi:hypothetical protein